MIRLQIRFLVVLSTTLVVVDAASAQRTRGSRGRGTAGTVGSVIDAFTQPSNGWSGYNNGYSGYNGYNYGNYGSNFGGRNAPMGYYSNQPSQYQSLPAGYSQVPSYYSNPTNAYGTTQYGNSFQPQIITPGQPQYATQEPAILQSGYVLSPQGGVITTGAVMPMPGTTATAEVAAPDGATVTLNGVPANTQSGTRKFVSPPLDPNQTYVYRARVTWTENGQERSREKAVDVKAGQTVKIDLSQPQRNRDRDQGSTRTSDED